MPTRIEFHILQSFAPSNLNRDDTGSPKDAVFGGTRRGRISSQALKRATRLHMKDGGLIPEQAGSTRSKRLASLLAKRLEGRVDSDTAKAAAVNLLEQVGGKTKMKVKKTDDGEPLTEYLMFVGEQELNEIAEVIANQPDELSNPKSKALNEAGKQITNILRKKGAGSVDVALYGRMLANLPEGNADAACQVAHAISTHRVDRDFDYFTAVDDENPEDSSGAGMIGTVEFNSSVYYRYSVVDLEQLRDNLSGDEDLATEAVAAYARAVVESAPSGKQNTFAAHNMPSVVLVTIRKSHGPRSLTNAFEKPVLANGRGLVDASAIALRDYWKSLDAAYGEADSSAVLDLTSQFAESEVTRRVRSLDELVAFVRAATA